MIHILLEEKNKNVTKNTSRPMLKPKDCDGAIKDMTRFDLFPFTKFTFKKNISITVNSYFNALNKKVKSKNTKQHYMHVLA